MSVTFKFDTVISAALRSFILNYNNALRDANLLFTAIPSETRAQLATQADVLVEEIRPLTNGSDLDSASTGLEAIALLEVCSAILKDEAGAALEISVDDPNLYELACEYYEDPTLWKLIANASGLSDPFPGSGTFDISIPLTSVPKITGGALFE